LAQSSSILESFRGKKVAITGGLGFIGSNLARHLVDLGAEVLLIDSLIPEYGGNLFNIKDYEDKLRVNIADVRDKHGMAYLIRDQDFIFNLAGQTSHLDSMADPYTDLEINCRSQLSLLEVCREYNPGVRIIFASTRQIYGKPEYLPVDESHPLRPVDVNGINKLAGEHYHILYNNVYGIRSAVLRLTNTYGPQMRVKDARQTFLGWWIRLLLEDREIEIFGDGAQLRDFNFVDDAVEAFVLAASQDASYGRVMNLGSKEIISLGDLAQLMVEINGKGRFRIVPFPPERKSIDIGDYYSDYSQIESILGWNPKTTLRTGLARSLSYFREHRTQYW
jgi:UDP-glucose 4-epimerase